jgi:hypothetical protein
VKNWTTFDWMLAALVIVLLLQGSGSMQGCGSSVKPTLVVVLYESQHGEPPAYAAGAINELREAGRDARMLDDDPATGLDSVPTEVAPAIEPGRKIMGGTDGKGHAMVLLNGVRVLKAIPLPASREAIVEAAQ